DKRKVAPRARLREAGFQAPRGGRSNMNETNHTRFDSERQAAAKPRALPVIPATIPLELRSLDRWLVWKYVPEKEPQTEEVFSDKPPLPARGGPGSSTNRKTWSPFGVALDAYRAGELDGLGFALNVPDDFDGETIIGVDLDHCRNPQTGQIEHWAQQII